ncbi:MAG TPA: hypothetical protein VMA34_00815 [Terracidiphilus sp.]|nr:hypothetical protein [Terracidiphilus sp.]
MELFLNLAWFVLAAAMVALWLRFGAQIGCARRRTQCVALGLLAVVLFPVISVTDDLQAAHNPAEVDCCVRRAHEMASAPLLHSGPSAPPPPAFASPVDAASGWDVVTNFSPVEADSPELSSIQNRPPPSA